MKQQFFLLLLLFLLSCQKVSKTMYFCGYDPCRNSAGYGKLTFQMGIPVWNRPGSNWDDIHHRVSHGDVAIIVEQIRIGENPGGLWYRLEEGGWTNDLWVTDTICTPENLDRYAITDCSIGDY